MGGALKPVETEEGHQTRPKFSLPVDSEHKAKVVKLWSFAAPHMRSFHLNWVAFFCTFWSAYSAAPLISIIRQDLNLTQYQANVAGVVTTAGTVPMRVLMGQACDLFGPRLSYAVLLFCTAPFLFGMSIVKGAAGYICMRLLIGFSLAAFVTCQFWTSIMFSPNVVGIANAVAGGWGNAGGGIAQVIMPNLTKRIANKTPETIAWRWSFFLPGSLHILLGLAIMFFGQDTPDGSYAQLEKTGKKSKSKPLREFINGMTNYRMWCLAAVYAYSFGVELAVNNVLSPYLQTQFGYSVTKSGNLAATFGLLNFVSRPLGGVASDLAASRWGMRGRIWVLFVVQAGGGLFISLMGVTSTSFGATMTCVVLSAFFIEATCGAVYGVTPFISRRSCGLVSGLVSAGGAIGGVINQAIFFLNTEAHGSYVLSRPDSFKWLGVVMCAVAILGVGPIYFPAWGGMIFPAREGATEEEYYFAEYTAAEREQGIHMQSSLFAQNSRSMRGMKRLRQDSAAELDKKPNGAYLNGNSAAELHKKPSGAYLNGDVKPANNGVRV